MNKAKIAPQQTPSAFRVAYHDGPPAITFYGITWQRGVPQAVAAEEWAAMQARGDFKEFDFRLGETAPAVSTHGLLEE